MSAQPKVVNQLKGKKVAIIGGSSGLGFGAASALIEEGASVFIGSSNPSRVEEAIKRLSDSNVQYNADSSRVGGHAVNLAGPDAENSLKEFFNAAGKIDHLIYSAGDSVATMPLEQVSYEGIVKAAEIRFISAILAVKTAVYGGHLKEGGSVVLTTGSVAEKPMSNWGVVAGFASGLYGLTKSLAFDLSTKNIRVNAVSPGAVMTEMWDPLPKEHKQGLMDHITQTSLVHHIAQPHEIAQVYLYLLKDTNMTGETITSDGGNRFGPAPQA